jgi:hypothetical protein
VGRPAEVLICLSISIGQDYSRDEAGCQARSALVRRASANTDLAEMVLNSG